MPISPDLEVAIVSHGAQKLLRNCLGSLAEHPPRGEMRVTVIDSGSLDSTPDMVEREFPGVRLIRQKNIGFSAANNLVLRDSNAKAILLLNPDTEVYAGTLDAVLGRLWSKPRIGMVGCKLVTESGMLDHACKRSFPTPAKCTGSLHRDRPRQRCVQCAHGLSGHPPRTRMSRGRSMLLTAPSCSAAPRRSTRLVCSMRVTGSTWRTSTGVLGSGGRAGESSMSPLGCRCISREARAADAGLPDRRFPSTAAWVAFIAASRPPSTQHCLMRRSTRASAQSSLSALASLPLMLLGLRHCHPCLGVGENARRGHLLASRYESSTPSASPTI